MEIDQEIFNMMLAKSMHQIARIEFRNSKFPYARGLCPLATRQGALPPGPRQGASPLEPPLLVNNLGPPLSSGWIRPWLSYQDHTTAGLYILMHWNCNKTSERKTNWATKKQIEMCLWFFSYVFIFCFVQTFSIISYWLIQNLNLVFMKILF